MASLTVRLDCAMTALALLVCLALISVSEGRQIKSIQHSRFIVSADRSIDNTVAPEKVVPFVAPGERTGFGRPDVGNTDNFRPTTPGSSPGVGHSLEGFMQKAVALKGLGRKTNEDSRPLTASPANGSRATGPGHSPGVGHVVENREVAYNFQKEDVYATVLPASFWGILDQHVTLLRLETSKNAWRKFFRKLGRVGFPLQYAWILRDDMVDRTACAQDMLELSLSDGDKTSNSMEFASN